MIETHKPQHRDGAARRGSGSGGEPPKSKDAAQQVRVLVIEDEPGIRDFLARGLANAGFVVAVAADGTEGERLALSDSFDAIVLDLMLPGRSGLQILVALGESRPNVPVVVLTARGRV